MQTCSLIFSAVFTFFVLKMCFADRMIHDAAEIVVNSKRLNATEWSVYKYNKTHAALAITWFIPNERELWNYTVYVDGYQRLGMEWIYKKSALSIALPFCTFVSGGMANMKDFNAHGNMIEGCKDLKGPHTYSVRDFIWEEQLFPMRILPGNYWKIDLKYKSDYDDDMLNLLYFFHIDRSRNRRNFKLFNLPGK